MNKLVPILLIFSICLSFVATTLILKQISPPSKKINSATIKKNPANQYAKQPHLKLEPNLAAWDQNIRIYGTNFCSDKICSPVTLKLEDKILKSEIKTQNGQFEEIVQIQKPSRIKTSYLLTAQQKNLKTGIVQETVSELTITEN